MYLGDIVVGAQIHLLVFDQPLGPLDKDIVSLGSLAIHADRHLVLVQNLREVMMGELTIGVEGFSHAIAGQCFLHSLGVKRGNVSPVGPLLAQS
jgi:hypothetical protein